MTIRIAALDTTLHCSGRVVDIGVTKSVGPLMSNVTEVCEEKVSYNNNRHRLMRTIASAASNNKDMKTRIYSSRNRPM